MKDKIDYEIVELLREFVDLKTYDKIILSLNTAKSKNNLNYEEFNHILYLTLKIIGFIDVFFYLDVDVYDEYVSVVCETITNYSDRLSKGTYSLYFELVNMLYNLKYAKTNKKMKDFLIKKILENKSFNFDNDIDYLEFVDNLKYKKKINKKTLSDYIDFQYKSDHTIIIDFLKKYFRQMTFYRYTFLARYFKEKMDAINMVNNKAFLKRDYEHLEIFKSLDTYEIYDEDLMELEEWIDENIFDDNGHSFKTNLNHLYKIVSDYLEEVKPEKKESKVINLEEKRAKLK